MRSGHFVPLGVPCSNLYALLCPQAALDQWKAVEREHQEAINEEAKHLEKLANKRSLLLKKV